MGLSFSKRESKVIDAICYVYLLGLPVLAWYTYGKKRSDRLPPFGMMGYLLVLGVALGLYLKYFFHKSVEFKVDSEGNQIPVYKPLENSVYDYWYAWIILGAVLVYGIAYLIFGKDHKKMYQVLSYFGNLTLYLLAYLPFLFFVAIPLVLDFLPLEDKKRKNKVAFSMDSYTIYGIGVVVFLALFLFFMFKK